MKITIQDVPPVYEQTTGNRAQRLTKPTIDLATAPYAILVLRISLGLLFLAHGCLKVFIFTLPGTAQFFKSVELPGWMAAPVAIAELVGGLLLVGGVIPDG
jgi:putative oxidoreductase